MNDVSNVQKSNCSKLILKPRFRAITNLRCRNFDLETLQKHELINHKKTRFLVFARNPASFVLSASRYHLRGGGKWTRADAQLHLGGLTLSAALNATESEAEQQIIIMKHFSWLYESQCSFAPYFSHPKFKRIKTEDLFTSKDDRYFADIASFLRLGDNVNFVDALKNASPAFKMDLPSHSTGSFLSTDPLMKMAPEAVAYFKVHWQKFADVLGY